MTNVVNPKLISRLFHIKCSLHPQHRGHVNLVVCKGLVIGILMISDRMHHDRRTTLPFERHAIGIVIDELASLLVSMDLPCRLACEMLPTQ